jgi:hypothetical protein
MNQIRDQSFSPGSAGTRWENLQRVGLHADVKTLETYEDRVLEGMKKLRLKIQKQPSSSLSVQDVKAYHKVLFDKVHPWCQRRAEHRMKVAG